MEFPWVCFCCVWFLSTDDINFSSQGRLLLCLVTVDLGSFSVYTLALFFLLLLYREVAREIRHQRKGSSPSTTLLTL